MNKLIVLKLNTWDANYSYLSGGGHECYFSHGEGEIRELKANRCQYWPWLKLQLESEGAIVRRRLTRKCASFLTMRGLQTFVLWQLEEGSNMDHETLKLIR